MPHPDLWPAIIGAALGFAAIVWSAIWLAQRWRTLPPRWRWGLFTAACLFEVVYWVNVYAWLIEPRMLVVRRVEIVSQDWQGAPLTIAALSDTHVGGPHVSTARVGRIVERVNALHPDLVVLLGDYAGGHAPEAERSPQEQQEILGGAAAFAALDAPLGAVAVLGNHDSWFNRASITRALEDAGVAALWNRNVVINRDGGAVVVAGIADAWTGVVDFGAALDGAAGRDTILLSHSPDPFADMPDGPALMLAAHSHCGQVTIPLLGRPVVPIQNRRYACHLVRENGRVMYVTGGIGTSILPVRFLNPPEIVLITIRGASGAVERV
ncbi:MAG: metallophosphoesterase [Hyphomonadaceae bacterium]